MLQNLMNLIAGKSGVAGTPADPAERTRVAAAVILLEAAHSDQNCTPSELDLILATIKESFALSQERAEDLVEVAHGERRGAIDLWQFTDRINRHLTREEKQTVMEGVWRIIHADGRLHGHEDHFAHKVAQLLRLSHPEMIAAKIRARDMRREAGG